MHYTIATLNEKHGNLTLNFDKAGNAYLVGLYNNKTQEYTHKTFISIEQAIYKFNELSAMIIKGLYSEQCKREFLQQ